MESMISRRDFLQATAAASAIVAASGLGPLGRVAAQQRLTQADILKFDPLGTVTLLHVTDIHAQLVPLYFREPSIRPIRRSGATTRSRTVRRTPTR
jgi:sulfur-oxidizing protein SoxB